MNILFLSSLNPRNINNWSGTLYYIFHSLKSKHSVHWEGENLFNQIKSLHKANNKNNTPFIPEQYAPMFGKILSKKFDKTSQYDIIIARDYYYISYFQTNIPIVYIGDTTFNLFKDYLGVTNTQFAHIAEKIIVLPLNWTVFSLS